MREHLLSRLAADDRLKIPHHARVGGRTDHRTDDIMRVNHARDPIPDRFAGCVLQSARPARHRNHRRAKEPHAPNVECLTTHVLLTHVYDALESKARAHGGRGDTMLPGTRLGDDSLFSHSARQQHLTNGVVDLVRAGVVEVLAFEPHARADVL